MPDKPELSLADETPETPTPGTPGAGHPLGTPNPSNGTPDPVQHASIVDTILDLDELLSADVRRAEKTARFCIEPWREARIDELNSELDRLTDAQGNPLAGQEETVVALATEVQAEQVAYGQAFRSVRMLQMPDEEWGEFRTKWREALDKGAPFPNAMFDELIVDSAIKPPISAEQVASMRARLGHPVMDELQKTAWEVNASSGVSIPKSLLSSHVLRRAARAQS